MAAHRYWKLAALALPVLGVLELSEARLYAAGALADTTAALTSTLAPSSGAIASLADGSAAAAVTWPAAAWMAGGFALQWDLGAAGAADVNGLRLGSGSTSDRFPVALQLSWSDDAVAWTLAYGVQDIVYPGNFALTTQPVSPVTSLVVETPTLWTPDRSSAATILGERNLYASFSPNIGTQAALSASSGKWYWEITARSRIATGTLAVGVATDAAAITQSPGVNTESWAYYSTAQKANGAGTSAYGATFTTNDTISVLLDIDAGTLEFWKNGATQGVAYATLAGKTLRPAMGTPFGSVADAAANFGQTAFRFAPPAGYTKGFGVRVGANLLPLQTFAPTRRTQLDPAQVLLRFPALQLPPAGTVSTRQIPAPVTALDIYFGGQGRIYGTVKERTAPVDTPMRRRVLLLDQRSQIVVRETWSDALTGAYEFPYLRMDIPFAVIAFDYTRTYRAVVADNLIADPM